MAHAPHIFSVPIGLSFLTEAVTALLDNKLVANIDMRDPDQLANTIIYVPSKRVARNLQTVLVSQMPNKASFLPDIRPLGETDDDEFGRFLNEFQQNGLASSDAATSLERPAIINNLERRTLLARLIRPWRESLPSHIRALFGRETINVPTNTADALWLARDLANLMDEMETENVDWHDLENVAPEDLAEWWQITISFLKCVFEAWPAILRERNQITPAQLRNQTLKEAQLRLERAQNNAVPFFNPQSAAAKPVLVFGSTGSIPAVAELIKTIAYLPHGGVIIPGLDRDLDEKAWQRLDAEDNNPAIFAHPQFTLKKLLQRLNGKRENVIFLGKPTKEQRQREKWISEIFRPADSTEEWNKLRLALNAQQNEDDEPAAPQKTPYLEQISLVEAPTLREEALSIAIALRASIEKKGAKAALITSDRVLARRVCGELARFGVQANDSGGTPLQASEPAALLQLLLHAIFEPGDAVALLALLKHPLTRLGCTRPDLRQWVEDFEFFALRGGAGRINLGQADDYMDDWIRKRNNIDNNDDDKIDAEQLERALRLCSQITAAAAPLYQFAQQKGEITLKDAVIATIATLENFGRDEQKSLARLYAQEDGQKIIQFFRSLLANQSGLTFKAQEWPKVLESLMSDEGVEMRQNGHPRLFILGLFEARLQDFDTVIIGGLNEGTLPASTKNSPFMSRMMKLAVSLPPPEQKTGFTAHDLTTLLATKQVILTRSLRVDNAPSIASRWLQRLQATITETDLKALKQRGQYYLQLGEALDYTQSDKLDHIYARPNPKPPVAMRPTHFTVTAIETLIHDPYAIYAKKVLKLKPLEPLIRDEDARERGILYHAILDEFGRTFKTENIHAIRTQAESYLLQIAKAEFEKFQLPPDIEVLWWPRFTFLVPDYIKWEMGLSPRTRHAEINAKKTEINDTGCFLSGRADRIDILKAYGEDKQHLAEIIDFKTGTNPTKSAALKLSSPQLALEGALLARGAFKPLGKAEAESLIYLRLTNKSEVKAEDISLVRNKKISAHDLCEKAWKQLDGLMRYFQNPETGYISQKIARDGNQKGDYDHLARISEWATITGEEE